MSIYDELAEAKRKAVTTSGMAPSGKRYSTNKPKPKTPPRSEGDVNPNANVATRGIDKAARWLTSIGSNAVDSARDSRVGNAIIGTAERRAAGHLGTFENALRNIQPAATALNSRASENRKRYEAETANAKHYREMLAKGRTPDGNVMSPETRARFENLAISAEKKANVYKTAWDNETSAGTGVINDLSDTGDRVSAKAEADLARGRQGLGKGAGLAYDVGTGAADLLADMAENVVVPGLGTTGRVSRMYGQGAEKAQAAGANQLQQTLAGGALAGIGEATNKLVSGNPILKKAQGAGLLDDFILKKVGGGKLASIGSSFVGEGLEEGLEDILDDAAERVIYDWDNKNKLTAKEVGYDALVGAILGGLTGVSGGKKPSNVQNVVEDVQKPAVSAQQDVTEQNTPAETSRKPVYTKAQYDADKAAAEQAEARVEAAKERGASDAEVKVLEAEADNARSNIGFVNEVDYNGIGGADAGTLNSRYDDLQAQSSKFYPEGPGSSRPTDVPMYDFDGKRVSKAVVTEMGANAIPDDVVPLIEQLVADGKLSVDTEKNSTAVRRAGKTIKEKGFRGAVEYFINAVNEGKNSADLTALGARLLSNAANNHDAKTVTDLLVAYTSMRKSAGRALQAGEILKKMPREYHLYAIQKTIDAINEKSGGKVSKKTAKAKAKSAAKADAVKQATSDAKAEAAENVVKEVTEKAESARKPGKKKEKPDNWIGRTWKPEPEKNHGVPVENWWTEIGNRMAEKISKDAEDTSVKRTPLTKIIQSDLLKFAEQYSLPKAKRATQKRTAAMRIKDFFDNRSKYVEAWRQSKDVLREKYKDNPDMLDALDEFLSDGSILYTGAGTDAVMMKAVADAAISGDTKLNDLVTRTRLGDEAAVVEQIFQTLNAEVQATGKDAEQLHNAVLKYVTEEVETRNLDIDQKVDSGIRKTMKSLDQRLSEVIKAGAKDKEELAERISNMLVNEYGISDTAADGAADYISNRFNTMVEDATRKRLESMFADSEPDEKKSIMDKFTELANMGAFADPEFSEKAAAMIFGSDGISIDKDTVDAYLNATTEEEADAAWEAVLDKVAEQLPSSAIDKWNAWRYTSMLGNLRTHGRNIIGNTGVQPMRVVKDRIAAAMEAGYNAIAKKTGGKQIERTKSFALAPKLWKLAWADSNNKIVQEQMMGSRLDDVPSQLERRKRVFDHDLPERFRKGVSNSLEAEDTVFKKITYTDALSGYLHANGVTPEMFASGSVDPELMNKARAYAIEEAKRATFQDQNALSDLVASIGSNLNGLDSDRVWAKVVKGGAKIFVEGNLPFKRTPANVFVSGMRYSPVGYVDAVVKAWEAKHGGNATANDVIDSIAAATTGSGMFALGAALLLSGSLSGSEDDDKQREFNGLQGKQEYALRIGDKTYTLDWMAPEAIPLFMGAEFVQSMAENGFGVKAIADAVKAASGPMLEMSMLSSLNDSLESIKYAEGNKVVALLEQTMASYLTQAIPTMAGQFERTFQDESMMTYVDPSSDVPRDAQKTIGKASARLPGLDYNQIPFVDAWGRTEQNGDILSRAFQNMLSPGFLSDVSTTEMETELQRLYDLKGENVFPSRADKSFTVDGKTVNLDKDKYVTYAKEKGQTSAKVLSAMQKLPGYAKLSDDDKIKATQEVYAYANAVAKSKVSGYKLDKTNKKIAESKMPPEAYIIYDKTKDRDGNGNCTNIEAAQTLLEMSNLTNTQRSNAWMNLRTGQMDEKKDPFQGVLPKVGISPEKCVDIMMTYSKVEKSDVPTKYKPQVFAQYLVQIGLDRKQQAVTKEVYKFWRHLPQKYK